MKTELEQFTMPRYSQIPAIGLFLEQTVKYINISLKPLGCMEITPSMVSNYVKKGYVKGPVKKQYGADSIAQLIFVTVAKGVLSMDNIKVLFDNQEILYSTEEAYNYFCDELENCVLVHFGIKKATVETETDNDLISILRSVIKAASHIIYLNDRLSVIKEAME